MYANKIGHFVWQNLDICHAGTIYSKVGTVFVQYISLGEMSDVHCTAVVTFDRAALKTKYVRSVLHFEENRLANERSC